MLASWPFLWPNPCRVQRPNFLTRPKVLGMAPGMSSPPASVVVLFDAPRVAVEADARNEPCGVVTAETVVPAPLVSGEAGIDLEPQPDAPAGKGRVDWGETPDGGPPGPRDFPPMVFGRAPPG